MVDYTVICISWCLVYISKTEGKQKDSRRGRQNLVAAEVATNLGITYRHHYLVRGMKQTKVVTHLGIGTL
jgi:hypothetical protein